jgi:hypothetical protein
MRELILKRIEAYRNSENGFPKSNMRWANFEIHNEHIHISKFDFNSCDDEELLSLFERLIRKAYRLEII